MTSRTGFARFDPTYVRKEPREALPGLRHAVPEDVETIAAVNDASGRASNASSLEEAVRDPMRAVMVAVVGGVVVGWAKTHHFEEADDSAPPGHYLGGLTVLPDYRRAGIASLLTEARLDWIWSRTHVAWYMLNADNAASIRLHERWGFREVARGSRFHSTTFTGTGVLFSAPRPVGFRTT